MRVTTLAVALVVAGALAALGQEGTVQDIKHGAKKAGETIKEGVETVGEKTKEGTRTAHRKARKTVTKTKVQTTENREAATPTPTDR